MFIDGCWWILVVVVGVVGAHQQRCWTYVNGSRHLSMGAHQGAHDGHGH